MAYTTTMAKDYASMHEATSALKMVLEKLRTQSRDALQDNQSPHFYVGFTTNKKQKDAQGKELLNGVSVSSEGNVYVAAIRLAQNGQAVSASGRLSLSDEAESKVSLPLTNIVNDFFK